MRGEKETNVRFDYQNLNDGERKRYWSYGRCWLRRKCEWGARFSALRIEWHAPRGAHWGITLGAGDGGRDLQVTFSVPFLLTLYITVEDVFKLYAFGTEFDRGHDRQIGFYFFENAFWYHIWVGTMASWSRDYPWCRWWRQGSFHFASLLGKQTHTLEVLREGIPLAIPMPEGVYHATAKIQRRTWKRRFWLAHSRVETQVDVPKGIPFAGKGENSWDCGDDGLFGYGVNSDSLEHAVAHGVESVLISRRRYGLPSQEAITTALSAQSNG